MVSGVGGAGGAPHGARGEPAKAPGADGVREAAALRASAITRESTTQLTIVTDEGDRVTLSLHTALAASSATYSFRGAGEGGAVAVDAAARQRSVSREASLVVEGDLSEDELHDIRRLIHDARGVAKRFLRGDVAGALKRAARIDGGDSLAGFALSVQRTETVTSVAAAIQRAALPPAAAPAVPPAAPVVDPAPALPG
jgi:hypothetical protein